MAHAAFGAGPLGLVLAITGTALPPPRQLHQGQVRAAKYPRNPVPQIPPPLPDILRHYKARPPWPVAGVDYATGADPASILRNPADLDSPGITVDPARHVVTIQGSNLLLRDVDFTQDGGWGVNVTGRGLTIMDSRFRVGGRNIVPIAGDSTAKDLRIVRCTIDGGGQGVAGDPAQIWSLIAYNGTNLTIAWSRLLNAPQHYVEFRFGRLVVYGNLFERAGFYAGAHVNTIQFSGERSGELALCSEHAL